MRDSRVCHSGLSGIFPKFSGRIPDALRTLKAATKITDALGNVTKAAYDSKGNLIELTTPKGEKMSISYNSYGKPLSASFKYDAMGRRIEKHGPRTTAFLYDGMDIVQEIEDSTVTSNYVRTLNIDEPLARLKSDGPIRYYHQDGLGSVIALTDETGEIKTRYNYDPFGVTV